MPLSEHEERILAEIERQLAAEDPRLAARVRRPWRGLTRTAQIRLAVAIAVLGVISLFALVFHIAFGAFGISLLFVAILIGARALSTPPSSAPSSSVPPDERP